MENPWTLFAVGFDRKPFKVVAAHFGSGCGALWYRYILPSSKPPVEQVCLPPPPSPFPKKSKFIRRIGIVDKGKDSGDIACAAECITVRNAPLLNRINKRKRKAKP